MTDSCKQTRLSLPHPVYTRFHDKIEWRVQDPDNYGDEMTPALQTVLSDIYHHGKCQHLKTVAQFELPFHGKGHPITAYLAMLLEWGIEDTSNDPNWDEDAISYRMRETLLTKTKVWKEHGTFATQPPKVEKAFEPYRTQVRLPKPVAQHLATVVPELAETYEQSLTNSKPFTEFTLMHYGSRSRDPDSSRTYQTRLQIEQALIEAKGSLGERHFELLRERSYEWLRTGRFITPKRPRRDTLDGALRDAFRAEVETTAQAMVKLACELLRRKGSPLKAPKGFHADLRLKLSWHENRASSRGGMRNGKPWVSLALRELRPNRDTFNFCEYDHIANSKNMGTCHGSWQVYLAALVAHEVSHAVQHKCLRMSSSNWGGFTRSQLRTSHGMGWQEVYRYLRVSWVNKLEGFVAGPQPKQEKTAG